MTTKRRDARRTQSSRWWRVRLRAAVQAVFFLVFVVFTFVPEAIPGGEWLFRVDATSVLMAAVAARAFTASVLFALALLVVTLLFGRVFCGWVCPLGTIGDALDSIFRFPTRGEHLHWVKYAILAATSAMAIGGAAWVWLFDPMGWASRLVVALLPDRTDVAALTVVAVAFAALHVAFGRRAFCRIVCPLGAGLGVVARFARFGRRFDREACIDCDLCVRNNRSFAISPRPEDYDPMECFQCGECVAVCPTDALGFHYGRGGGRALAVKPGVEVHVPLDALTRRRPPPETPRAPELPGLRGGLSGGHGLSRRQALVALGGGAGLAATLAGVAKASPPPLRPPGSVEEPRFLDLCIRCTACIRTCPTQTLVPAPLRDGLAGFQAPVLVAREGGCLHGCNECGLACPTGAIAPLPLPTKQATRLGLASVDRARCIPWTTDDPCVSCSAACPFEAISLRPAETRLAWGDLLVRPEVEPSLCTGCGLCEAACPVTGSAAIRIAPAERQTPMTRAPAEERPFKPSADGLFVLPRD